MLRGRMVGSYVFVVIASLVVTGCGTPPEAEDRTPPTTVASPAGGTFGEAVTVSLSCSDAGGCAATYYTVDGSTPSRSAAVYAGAIALETTTTLRFFSVDLAGNLEAPRTEVYTLEFPDPPVTSADPSGGVFRAPQEVTLTCADHLGETCAATYYTTDGSPPTTDSLVYGSPVRVERSLTLRFFSVDREGRSEATRSETYVVDRAAPQTTATPAAGAYPSAQNVTLACDDGAGVGCAGTWYTLDGTEPTPESAAYEGPIALGETTELRFFSLDAAGNPEEIQVARYVIDGDAPTTVAAPGAGVYPAPVQVTLSCEDGAAGAGCAGTWFTTDGTEPTAGSPAYAGPIAISVSTPLRFFSVDAAGNAEAAQAVDYLIDTDAPSTEASPAGGLFGAAVAVALTCDDGAGGSGCAGTWYTTDGSEPTQGSAAYAAPLQLTGSTTLRYFSVDAAGHAEAPRTQAYLIDEAPPVTTPSPVGGSYAAAQQVALSCEDGASGSGCAGTWYTTDGSEPTQGAAAYAGPILVAASTTLRFFSADAAGHAEAPRAETYVIDEAPPVTTASPAGGDYDADQSVTLACTDGPDGVGCAATYYSTDGSAPTTASAAYTGPILLTRNTTLQFFSVDALGQAEAVTSEAYVIDKAAPTTTAAPLGGTYGADQSVILSCADGDGVGCAATYYTTDGSGPTTASALYAGPIAIAAPTTLQFFSVDGLGHAEALKTEAYLIDKAAPITTASVPGGTYAADQLVTLTCTDGDGVGCAATHYSTDGSVPTTASTLYAGPIAVSAHTSLQFFSLDALGHAEAVKTESYFIDKAAPTTTASVPGGTYAADQLVTLTCADGDGVGCAATYYSADGSVPTTASTPYAGPIAVAANTTLQFFSLDALGHAEAVKTEAYLIDKAAPVTSASPLGGTYGGDQSVTLSCADGEGVGCAATYYTTDGSAPTTASAAYTGPIQLAENATLRFFSVDALGHAEESQTEHYRIDQTPPVTTASPAGGTYASDRVVFLACEDGAAGSGCAGTWYTTDGGVPTQASTLYTGPIAISANTTLRFFSVDEAGHAEAVKTEVYVIDTLAPTTAAGPAGGTYSADQGVTLTCSDGAGGSGCAGTWYTTDGSVPTQGSPVYGGPLAITANTTLRFFSVDAAGHAEAVRTEVYVIDTLAPVTTAAPAGGVYNANRLVTLSCTDGDGSGCAVTYFTTDGADPTPSSAIYTGPISLTSNTTLKFYSMDALGQAEALQTEAYVIDKLAPVTTVEPAPGTYNTPLSVTLTCADEAEGSGCEATYYTTNGAVPGEGSPLYTAPLPLSEGTTTLRTRSRDLAGNWENTQTATYTLDTDPPAVAWTAPAGGSERVPLTASVTVTFDEAMDPASIDETTIRVDGVTGTVTYDAPTRTATFTPAGTLAGETLYTARATTGVQDAALNPMAAEHVFTFTTRTPVLQVSGDGSATLINHGSAYAASGEGLAVWVADTGQGCTLFYARYTGSQWRPEEALHSYASVFGCTNGDHPLAVATNGTSFMVAWREGSAVVAQEYAGGVWQPQQTVFADWRGRYTFHALHLASDGIGYALAFAHVATVNAAHASVYSAGAWSPPTLLQSSFSDCQEPLMTGGAAGYLVVWKEANGSSQASHYTAATGWSPQTQLTATTGGWPHPATNGTNFAVGYRRGTDVLVRMGDGTTWGAEASALGGASSVNGVDGMASNGSGYAILFHGSRAWVNRYAGGTWGTAALVEGAGSGQLYRFSIASNGTGYATLVEQIDFANDTRNLWSAAFARFPFCFPAGSACWFVMAAEDTEPLAQNPHIAPAGGGYALTWDQASSTAHQLQHRFVDTAGVITPAELHQVVLPTSAKGIRMAANDAGEVMAVWEQLAGGYAAIFASIFDGVTWGAPVLVADEGFAPTVASNGTGWAVAYSGRSGVRARIWSAGAFGPDERAGFFSANRDLQLASNGEGYALLYASYSSVYGNVYHRGAWGTLETLSSGTGTVGAALSLPATPTTYMAGWTHEFSGRYSALYRPLTFDPGADAWSWGLEALIETQSASVTSLSLTTDGVGFLAAFTVGSDLWVRHHAGAWGAEQVVDQYTGLDTCSDARAASNGAGFMVAYACRELRTAHFDGATWTDQGMGVPSMSGPRLASNGLDYALTWVSGGDVRGSVFASGAWRAADGVDDSPAALLTPVATDLVYDGEHFHAAWLQQDPVEAGLYRVYARRDF